MIETDETRIILGIVKVKGMLVALGSTKGVRESWGWDLGGVSW